MNFGDIQNSTDQRLTEGSSEMFLKPVTILDDAAAIRSIDCVEED